MNQYKPAYLAEHTKADASVQRLATRTVLATYWYDGKLLNADTVKEELSGGRVAGRSIDLEFSNAAGTFSADRDSGNLEIGNYLQLDHYLPGDTTEVRNYLYGRITAIDIPGEVATISVTVEDPDEFSQQWPTKVYTTDDWATIATAPDFGQNWINPSVDLGRAYPVGFGHCRRVRAVYVFADYTYDQYYYIFNRGVVEATNSDKGTKINVYRNRRLIDPDEYTVWDGSQEWPFGGYAGITFGREQSDGASYYEITVDYYGTLMGGATAERNPAYILKWLLSDATIGLGQSVNAASFAASATTLSTLGGGSKAIVIDGGVDEQVTLQDLIDHLAEDCARSFIYKNADNEWAITTDKYQSTSQASFGRGDGKYRNIIKLNKYGTPDDRTRELVVRYAKNKWTGEFAHSLTRTVHDDGEDRVLELPLIQDSEAADLIHCYLQRRELYGAREIDLDLGMEARDLVIYQPITVVQKWLAPDDRSTITNINGQFQVRAIDRGLYQWSVLARTNSSDIYTYSAGDLPTDPSDDALADYSFTPPSAPTGLAIASSGTRQGTDGGTYAYYRLSCTPPAVNCQHIEFGYKEKNAANYQWLIGEEDSGTWYGILEGLIPGQLYYFAARAVNNANAAGCTQGALAEITSGGSGYTAPGDTTPPGTITYGTATVKLKTWRFPWTKSSAADIKDYHVQISTVSNFASTVYDGYVGADYKEFTYDAAAYGTTLYARVKGRDHTGNESASWSSTMSATCSQIIGGDITDLTITGGKIADLAITNAKIANATITSAKIADLSADKITTGTITNQTITISTSAALNIDTGSGMVIKKAGSILLEADSSNYGNIIFDMGTYDLELRCYDFGTKLVAFMPTGSNQVGMYFGSTTYKLTGAAFYVYDSMNVTVNSSAYAWSSAAYYPITSTLDLGTTTYPWRSIYLDAGSYYWRIWNYNGGSGLEGLWTVWNGTGVMFVDGSGNLFISGALYENHWTLDVPQDSEWELFDCALDAFRCKDGIKLHPMMKTRPAKTLQTVLDKEGLEVVGAKPDMKDLPGSYGKPLGDLIQVLYECVHSLKTDMEKLKNAA